MKSQKVGLNFSIVDCNIKKYSEGSSEIVILGKGFGESIIIRSEIDDIIIIDSFLNPDTHRPIALDYLDKINVSYDKIKSIVITHWHQDHILGISDILCVCSDRIEVVLNPIIKNEKYFNYLNTKKIAGLSETSEFFKAINMIKDRKLKRKFVSIDKTIYNSTHDGIEVIALSPQDEEINSFIDNIISQKSVDEICLSAPDDNLLSIVILIKLFDHYFLLGSDMETCVDESSGWKAIVNNYLPKYSKSSFFKIPHHGSVTGNCEDVWLRLLNEKPLSVCTTYNKRKNLPTEEDKVRIVEKSCELYVAGEKNKLDTTINMEFKKYNLDPGFEKIAGNYGLVRLLFENNKTEIETIGTVFKYSNN